MAESGKRRARVEATARAEERHPGGKARHAQHRYKERRFVFAIAVSVGQYLPWGPRHDRAFANLYSRVTHVFLNCGEEFRYHLLAVGGGADRAAYELLQIASGDLLVDDGRVVRGDLLPRLAGGE